MGIPRSYHRTALHCALLGLMLMALASCDAIFGHKPPVRHAHAVSKTSTAEAYLTHLALARVELPADAQDTTAADAELDMVQAYNAKPAKSSKKTKPAKPEALPVIVLSFKDSGGSLTQVAVPAGKTQQKAGYPALLSVMTRLGAAGSTLHDLALATVTVAPDETVKLQDGTADDTRQALNQIQQRLMDGAQKPAALDDARGQLQLARLFMKHRLRDAAYLSVDNVKRQLASATRSQPGDAEAIKALSKELETLEVELHKTLPFTLSAQ